LQRRGQGRQSWRAKGMRDKNIILFGEGSTFRMLGECPMFQKYW